MPRSWLAVLAADHVAVQEGFSVLSWLQAPEDTALFLDMAMSPATAPDVVMELGFVLGNGADQVGPDDALAHRVAARIREVVRGPERPGVADQVRGLVYVLGMRATSTSSTSCTTSCATRCPTSRAAHRTHTPRARASSGGAHSRRTSGRSARPRLGAWTPTQC